MPTLAALLILSQGMTLAELKKIEPDNSEWTNSVVRFIGEASPTEANRAWAYYDEVLQTRHEELIRRANAGESVPSRQWFHEFHCLDREEGIKFARHLVRGEGALSVRLKEIARNARSDFPMKLDSVFFGPDCGSYDHNPEYMLSVASGLYRREYIDLLAREQFDGRAYLLENLLPGVAWDEKVDVSAELRPILVKLAAETNVLVRGQAILSLAFVPGQDVDRIVAKALRDPYMDTRVKALVAAGKRQLQGVLPDVVRLVKSEDWTEKRYAAQCMAQLGTPEAKAAFVELLKDPKQGEFAGYAKEANLVEALPVLLKRLNVDKDWGVFDAILALDPANRAERILDALRKKNGDLIWDSLNGAEQYNIRAAIPLIQQLIRDNNDWSRKAFAVLIDLDPENRSELVIETLNATDPDLLMDAIRQAQSMKLLTALPRVRELLHHPDQYVRLNAKNMIEKLAPPPRP